MNERELLESERRWRQSSPKPWTASAKNAVYEGDDSCIKHEFKGWHIDGLPQMRNGNFMHGADALFIVDAKAKIPKMIKHIRRMHMWFWISAATFFLSIGGFFVFKIMSGITG